VQICALSQLSLCTHNPDHSLYNYFSISVQFFPSEWPLNFFVSTIHQVIWPSPGTLSTIASLQASKGYNQGSFVYFAKACGFFLSFFLWFGRPKPITGLSGWWGPVSPLRTQETVPDRRTGGLPLFRADPRRVPRQVGKTVHNVGGLACILGLTNSHNQSP